MKLRLTETQLKECVNFVIKEQGFGDVPAGADNDPNAPWNQESEPEADLDGIEIVDENVDRFQDVYVVYSNDRGGEAEVTLHDILTGINLGQSQVKFFKEAIRQFPRPEEWKSRVMFVSKLYAHLHELDFQGGEDYEAPSSWDNADDYRDEINENSERKKKDIISKIVCNDGHTIGIKGTISILMGKHGGIDWEKTMYDDEEFDSTAKGINQYYDDNPDAGFMQNDTE